MERNISVGGHHRCQTRKIPPWESTAPYYTLSKKLDDFEEKLPAELKYNEFNLQAHIAGGSASDFAYFSGLLLLCRVFSTENTFMHLQKRLRQDGGKTGYYTI